MILIIIFYDRQRLLSETIGQKHCPHMEYCQQDASKGLYWGSDLVLPYVTLHFCVNLWAGYQSLNYFNYFKCGRSTGNIDVIVIDELREIKLSMNACYYTTFIHFKLQCPIKVLCRNAKEEIFLPLRGIFGVKGQK